MEKMTFRQWIENYWYHYKWHTIIGLLLTFSIAVSVTQCATQPDYDQTCILYCDRVVADNTTANLEKQMLPYTADNNNNGETLLDINNISYDSNTTQANNASYSNSQKLTVLVSTADYLLYIVDEYGFKRLTEQDNMHLFETYDFLPDKDHLAWNWKGSKMQKAVGAFHLPENLYFCIRKVAGTPYADDAEVLEREQQTVTMLKKLIADQTK